MPKLEKHEWIWPPLQGSLKCYYVGRGDVEWQRAVQFEIDERKYLSLVPKEAVDEEQKTMMISIIGLLEDGTYLIDLPAETLTSGPRLRIRKDDPVLVYDTQ